MKKINKIKRNGLIVALLASLCCGGMVCNAASVALPVLDSSLATEGATVLTVGNTMTINVTSPNAYLYFTSYDIGSNSSGTIKGTVSYTSLLSDYTIWNKVTGTALSNINGNITATGNGKIYLINPNGVNISDHANINANSFIASTLDNRISATDKRFDKTNIETYKLLTLNWDKVNQRNGILIKKGATINVSNRLDFIAPAIQNLKTAPITKATYTTADGVVFNLDTSNNIVSAQSIVVPSDGEVFINKKIFLVANPPKKVDDPDIPENELAYALQKDIKLKLIAPTDLKPYSFASYNLSGVQTAVNPIEKTKLVNQIASSDFNNENIGSIAVNDSGKHMLAVNTFAPVGAANKIEDNGFTPVGAAYKVEDNKDYDFVISEPILE